MFALGLVSGIAIGTLAVAVVIAGAAERFHDAHWGE